MFHWRSLRGGRVIRMRNSEWCRKLVPEMRWSLVAKRRRQHRPTDHVRPPICSSVLCCPSFHLPCTSILLSTSEHITPAFTVWWVFGGLSLFVTPMQGLHCGCTVLSPIFWKIHAENFSLCRLIETVRLKLSEENWAFLMIIVNITGCYSRFMFWQQMLSSPCDVTSQEQVGTHFILNSFFPLVFSSMSWILIICRG